MVKNAILTALILALIAPAGIPAARAGSVPDDANCGPKWPSRKAQSLSDSLTYSSSATSRSGVSKSKDANLNEAPSAPPRLSRRISVRTFGCDRQFLYRDSLLPIDSYSRQDGERLRPYLEPVPEALAALDVYQSTQRKARISSYVGTAGLVLAVGAFVVGNQFKNPDDSVSTTGLAVRTIGAISGLGIAVGGFFYSKGLLSTNEANLGRAVELYNRARPKDMIELQFSTEFEFEDLVPGD